LIHIHTTLRYREICTMLNSFYQYFNKLQRKNITLQFAAHLNIFDIFLLLLIYSAICQKDESLHCRNTYINLAILICPNL
jgi:hypothetical protein